MTDARRVRPLPGPEPAFDPPADRGRLRPRRRPTSSSRRPRTSSPAGPRSTQLFGVVGGFGGGVNQGNLFVTLVPRKQRKLSQAEFVGRPAPGAQRHPGAPGGHPGPLPAGLHRPARLPGRVLGPRLELGPARRGRANGSWAKLRESGLVVDLDTDYQLGHARAAGRPRPGHGRRFGVSIDDVATTLNALVGGVRVGKYSTGGRRIDVRLKLLAAQRIAARGHRPAAGADARRAISCPLSSLVTYEGAAGAPGHHPPRPGAGHHHLRQRRPRALPERGPQLRRGAGPGARRSATASSSAARASPSGSR